MRIVKVDEAFTVKRTVEAGKEKEQQIVDGIIKQVREQGDEALFSLTRELDGVDLNQFKVEQSEIKAAYNDLEPNVVEAIREAIERIRDFHQRQVSQSWLTTKPDGVILGQKVTPLDRVGVYVPGGKAAYPSSVIMNVVPAQVAGVGEVAMVSPALSTGQLPAGVLVTANELGIKEIYKIGGAQAVAALAYGTETIAPVDKITGPGNIYVALAKRAVYGVVDIDMIAGPSDITVLADETAIPAHVAADLLSQAEHDELATAVLVTDSKSLAEAVSEQVEYQLQSLPKEDIARASIENQGVIYLTENLEQSIRTVNQIAPEHLEIIVQNPMDQLGKIRHAGAIFLGPYTTEPVGDYFAGPNHVLPTEGTARFSSPLTVDDFVKKSSVLSYSKEALIAQANSITALARLEGLEAHARAVEIRLGDDSDE
ncbi:histidinol dehydrogenase [Alkalicoccobacillus porphyridii]|uniref:Histidinol dehydrogenase n=1 Tax=Alkalicoccobacillus porphyridii TaxID=2597270 RepID=A0A554A3N0_9BACI|nr:histidinol dehydrogenase [Alkalicoccobacillus porphyridii]TSB48290.1 histidinol dehydrogenase [Alkalicoccobacillus porphyridii]